MTNLSKTVAGLFLCLFPYAAMAGIASPVAIGHAWSPATPNGATTAAAYMSIENHGQSDDRLIGGTSPTVAKISIHQMSMAGGIRAMRELTGGLAIPAGGSVELEPRASYHLMLSGLKAPLKDGTHLPLTLKFAKAGDVHVDIPVLPIGSRGPAAGDSRDHMDHH